MIHDYEDGKLILVDKPLHWTSFDVVKKLKYGLKLKKIGHAGTLDPLATGLLILCSGKMTKQIESFQAREKEYTGTFVIGSTTPSYDLETEIQKVADTDQVGEQEIRKAVSTLTGEILQVPPLFSAIKVNGKRAYTHARKGEEVPLKERGVRIDVFETARVSPTEISFRIICSKGTYIRSIARDLGDELGTGAYLASLRRTRIGEFTVEQASSIEQLLQQ